ncbi:MAG: hypothetical protein L6300_04060 [Syntrophaceae bacterium]|nr:hypothetical protein [Syntrophaceae bacterium]
MIGDVTDQTAVQSAMQGVNAVVHVAGALNFSRNPVICHSRENGKAKLNVHNPVFSACSGFPPSRE